MAKNLPIAIDIGNHAIKVAQGVSDGMRPRQIRYAYTPLPADYRWEPGAETAPLLPILRTALQEAGTKGNSAVCVLPRDQVTLRFTQFPKARREDALRMAMLEAEQHIPLPAAETVVGYEALGDASGPDILRAVMIAAARKNVVHAYLSLLDELGLESSQITLDSLCLYRLWKAQLGGSESALLIDLGGKKSVISSLADGLLYMSRAVDCGGDNLTAAFAQELGCTTAEAERVKREEGLARTHDRSDGVISAWLNNLCAEIRRSTLASPQRIAQPQRIYLTGGNSLVPQLPRILESKVGLPVAHLTVAQNLIPPAREPLFSLAISASLQAAEPREALNLVPSEVVTEETDRRKKRFGWGLALAIIVAVVVYLAGTLVLVLQRESQIRQLDERMAEADRITRQATSLRADRRQAIDRLEYLSNKYDDKHRFLDLLLQIHDAAPPKVWLTNLMVETRVNGDTGAKTILQATGKAPDNERVADLIAALSHIPNMVQVDLQSATNVPFGQERVVEFSLSCELTSNPIPAEAAADDTP